MAKGIEYKSSSVAKAVKMACKELDLPEDKLRYEIISYGSSGIFGLVGTKKARIRVTVPEKRMDAPPKPAQETKPVAAPEVLAEQPLEAGEETKQESVDAPADSEGPAELGRQVLQRMIDFITSGATISVKNSNDRIEYHVQGGNTGVLIGKRGQTLEAMQYLVDKIVSKKFEKRFRLQIDVEDYLKNRRINLENMAKKMGEKAKRTGKPISFGQMNAHDRRIVHIALKADEQVRTQSMGDGFYRKLVIFPKKRNGRKQK